MNENSQNDRVYAAQLLRSVRLGELSVKQAVLKYPNNSNDESLIAAYHALIHYEADEDIRLRDIFFREEQDDYLEFIYTTLENGADLPQNIIDSYKEFYKKTPVLLKKNAKGFWETFWQNLNIKDD